MAAVETTARIPLRNEGYDNDGAFEMIGMEFGVSALR